MCVGKSPTRAQGSSFERWRCFGLLVQSLSPWLCWSWNVWCLKESFVRLQDTWQYCRWETVWQYLWKDENALRVFNEAIIRREKKDWAIDGQSQFHDKNLSLVRRKDSSTHIGKHEQSQTVTTPKSTFEDALWSSYFNCRIGSKIAILTMVWRALAEVNRSRLGLSVKEAEILNLVDNKSVGYIIEHSVLSITNFLILSGKS